MPKPIWISMGTAHGPDNKPLVDLWSSEPVPRKRVGGMNATRLASLCAAGFLRVTGIRMRPGDKKQVRFSVDILN